MTRKKTIRKIVKLMVKSGPPSDGKPIRHGGGACYGFSFPTKGWRDFDCFVEMDNGDKYKVGFKGIEPPKVEFVQAQFDHNPAFFTKLDF